MEEKIIFKAIVGSTSYSTSIDGLSDIDYKGIYIQSIDDIITFNYKEQINVTKDETYYEVRRFLQLLQTGNPTTLELLFSPKECIVETSPQFDLIIKHREKFLTKKCFDSFAGYAKAQIYKAKGLEKKMNWEKNRIERKTPIDFVYVTEDGKTFLIEEWLKTKNMKQEYCGLTKLDHFRDCYSLYYDYQAEYGKDSNRVIEPLGFKGIIVKDGNELRLSIVPKYMKSETVVYYNKEAYSTHCKDYKSYQEWLANRNTNRYVDIENHEQKIDGKNLLHCRRLLDMAIEIATEKTINVKRPNAEYLISIRKGKVDLDSLIENCKKDIDRLGELFEKSGLPEGCDKQFVNDLLLEIRKM